MTSGLTISVAMATYNGARFIGAQLESLARQTVLPAELMVGDDNSSDATLDIVKSFAARAPFPVRIERNSERLGYRANFMETAGLCRSNLIAFADQDDVWLPRKLEFSLAGFTTEDTLLTYHNATVVTADMEPVGSLAGSAAPRPVNPPRSIEPWNYGLGFTLMFRRWLLDFSRLRSNSSDFYFADELEAHDQWIFFLAACLGRIAYISEPLVLYRQHRANICGWSGPVSGFRARWRNLLSTDLAAFGSRELAAGKRAVILERIFKELEDSSMREAAKLAAHDYRKLEAAYRMRRKIYQPASAFLRWGALMSCLRRGGYKPKRQWGTGPEALARDMIRGVLFPAGTEMGS